LKNFKAMAEVKIFDRYLFDSVKDKLGEGGFSTAYKAKDLHRNRVVVLKIYDKQGVNKYDIIHEIEKVENIHHPNLVRYYDAFYWEVKDFMGDTQKLQVGVLEYINGGQLSDYFRQGLPLSTFEKFIDDIMNGLYALHQEGIIHLDLKPENIFIQKNETQLIAKIGDFGLSRLLNTGEIANTSTMSAITGTPDYIAPEQVLKRKFGINGGISFNADIWALGVIVLKYFTGKSWIPSSSQAQVIEEIISQLDNGLNLDISQLPEKWQHFVRLCLEPYATKRVKTIPELKQKWNEAINGLPETTTHSEQIAKGNNDIHSQKTLVIPKKEYPNQQEKSKKNKKISILIALVVFIVGLLYLFFNQSNITDSDKKDITLNKNTVYENKSNTTSENYPKHSNTKNNIPNNENSNNTELIQNSPKTSTEKNNESNQNFKENANYSSEQHNTDKSNYNDITFSQNTSQKTIPQTNSNSPSWYSNKIESNNDLKNEKEATPKQSTALSEIYKMGYKFTKEEFFDFVKKGDVNMVKKYLDAGMSANIKDNDGRSVLMVASGYGHSEIAKMLIANGASVNDRDYDDWTSLRYAVNNGHTPVVKILIQNGAFINSVDNEGWTALMIASYRGYTDIVKYLIEKGANLNAKDSDGLTAYDWALKDEIREILKKHGGKSGNELR
jgi:serine/threonine protein kinase